MLKEKIRAGIESMNTKAEASASFYKNMFRLAFPIVIQNLITTAVSSADVIMLGWVSQTALSPGVDADLYVRAGPC